MRRHVEIELSFALPPDRREALRRALHARGGVVHQARLVATVFDTPDRRLARAGLAWRVRREGRRWVQALKQGSGWERFEHEVICPGPEPDPLRHAGTDPGDRLARLLREAREEGLAAGARCRIDVRRSSRRLRMGAALVEVSLDEGRIVAGAASEPVCEVEFELVEGPLTAMLAGVHRWSARHGLTLLAETKAERGDRLADGRCAPWPVRARLPVYAPGVGVGEAFAAVVDECFGQALRNLAGLLHPAVADAVEPVHQLRVGLRRLRTALRLFDGLVAPALAPPAPLVEQLRASFDAFGRCRDQHVREGVVAQALAAAGAPPVRMDGPADVRSASQLAADPAVQAMLLDGIAWRASFARHPPSGQDAAAATADAPPLPAWSAAAWRRLRRWHRRILADAACWPQLDEPAVHRLRRRIKRLRYAAEFLSPVLRRRPLRRLLRALEPVQQQLGELNDLLVAREAYAAALATQPAAGWALGFIAARLEAQRSAAGAALAVLAKAPLPALRRGVRG